MPVTLARLKSLQRTTSISRSSDNGSIDLLKSSAGESFQQFSGQWRRDVKGALFHGALEMHLWAADKQRRSEQQFSSPSHQLHSEPLRAFSPRDLVLQMCRSAH